MAEVKKGNELNFSFGFTTITKFGKIFMIKVENESPCIINQ